MTLLACPNEIDQAALNRHVEADIAGTIEAALRPSSSGAWIRGRTR